MLLLLPLLGSPDLQDQHQQQQQCSIRLQQQQRLSRSTLPTLKLTKHSRNSSSSSSKYVRNCQTSWVTSRIYLTAHCQSCILCHTAAAAVRLAAAATVR
jgi:hypothetical protein